MEFSPPELTPIDSYILEEAPGVIDSDKNSQIILLVGLFQSIGKKHPYRYLIRC